MIESSAIISEDERFRYLLTRRWAESGRVGLVIGFNPSTAGATTNDPTILRLIHFFTAWGCAGFRIWNPIPYRSSSPIDAVNWAQRATLFGADRLATQTNRETLLSILDYADYETLLLCAWGANARLAPSLIRKAYETCTWGRPVIAQCLGVTKDGHPIHPMARGVHRVSDDARPQPFVLR